MLKTSKTKFTFAFPCDGIQSISQTGSQRISFPFLPLTNFRSLTRSPWRPTGWGAGNKERWKFSFLACSIHLYFCSFSACHVRPSSHENFSISSARCTYFSDTHTAEREAVRSQKHYLTERPSARPLLWFQQTRLSLNFPFYGGWRARENL